jgi:hypothetical protein
MEQRDIESMLWDCVTAPTDDNSHLGYQTTGIDKLAALLADQQRRIGQLEARVADLTTARATEK